MLLIPPWLEPVWPVIAGFVVAGGVMPVVMVLARSRGVVSRVREDRWHRTGVVPRFAGPALLAALLPWLTGPEALVLTGFCGVGCWDDLRPLSARSKALLLAVPSVAAAALTGTLWLAPGLWFMANALNLLDHADGLAAAVATTALLAAGTPAGLAAGGAALAFLCYNYPPARTFMGDGGSLLLGAAMLLLWAPTDPLPTLGWCAVPLADAVFVTLRRIKEGRPPWIGGVDHSGHILLRAGVPPFLLPPLYAGVTLAVGWGLGQI